MPSTALIFSKSARPRVNPLRRARGFRILRMSNHLPHIVPFGSNLSRIVRLRDPGTAAAPDCEDAIRATPPVWRDHGRHTLQRKNQCSIQSAHFSTWPSVPHGITGTDEVEFFGEPSISLSEYTM